MAWIVLTICIIIIVGWNIILTAIIIIDRRKNYDLVRDICSELGHKVRDSDDIKSYQIKHQHRDMSVPLYQILELVLEELSVNIVHTGVPSINYKLVPKEE